MMSFCWLAIDSPTGVLGAAKIPDRFSQQYSAPELDIALLALGKSHWSPALQSPKTKSLVSKEGAPCGRTRYATFSSPFAAEN
jgi:hypothetical protein